LRKVLSYGLLIVFLFNTMGYYLLFELGRYQVRKEMHAKIREKSNSISVIRIGNTVNNPRFVRLDEGEIRYDGEFFDVIHEEKTSAGTVFYCLRDTDEENLVSLFHTISKKKSVSSLYEHMVTIALPVAEPATRISQPEVIQYIQPDMQFTSRFLTTWTPPPEFPGIS
jgi:hypothetical protein